MSAKTSKTQSAAGKHVWTDAQLRFLAGCELLGADFYAAFRRRFKVSRKSLSDQAIRARRVYLYKAYGWS